MKKFILALFIVFLTTSTALAGWQKDFASNYTANGLNTAVTNALARGISPAAITEVAMAIDGMNGAILATAMCDGGVSVQALQDFLSVLGISQQTAIKSCGGQGNISATGAFPGAAYSSAGKEIIFSDDRAGGVIGGGTPGSPASGNNFNR